MRRLLLGAVLLILACGGAATLPAPSRSSPSTTPWPTALIDVNAMMGTFPAATFFVVTDDGVKALAVLNHTTKYTIPTAGAAQVAAGGDQIYIADETSDGTRLRRIDQASGAILATSVERARKLVPTGVGHGALVVEPTTSRVLAMYADGERRVVEAYHAYSLRPLGRRLDATCGDRLLAAADRVAVACFAAGTVVIKDNTAEPRIVPAGIGTFVAAAMSADGTTLVGREDGTLARIRPTTVTPEKMEPFRPARLAPDGIASPDFQSFAIALLTADLALGVSELRSSVRYISFPAGERIKEIPVGGLLAEGQFAFWSNGREARHVDLYQGFAETMGVLSGTRVLPGAVGQ